MCIEVVLTIPSRLIDDTCSSYWISSLDAQISLLSLLRFDRATAADGAGRFGNCVGSIEAFSVETGCASLADLTWGFFWLFPVLIGRYGD